jgi:hypothetical protein
VFTVWVTSDIWEYIFLLVNLSVTFTIFSGDTATCLYNSPHEDESLPRVLPGKLLTLDAQCRKDRGTSACFVSSLISSAKYSRVPILRICLIHRWYSSDFTKDWSMIYLTMCSKINNLQISLILRYLNVFNYNKIVCMWHLSEREVIITCSHIYSYGLCTGTHKIMSDMSAI